MLNIIFPVEIENRKEKDLSLSVYNDEVIKLKGVVRKYIDTIVAVDCITGEEDKKIVFEWCEIDIEICCEGHQGKTVKELVNEEFKEFNELELTYFGLLRKEDLEIKKKIDDFYVIKN